MKTVRFAEVVKRCGKPEPYVLWTKPESDPEFKRAIEKKRVMTVHQENSGGKKDYGIVGFTKDPHGELLVFPKALQRFAGKRVVGVRYDLLEAPTDQAPAQSRKSKRKPEKFPVFKKAPTPSEAEPETESPAKFIRKNHPKQPSAKAAQPASPPEKISARSLIREVRRALIELKKGKAVAAYDRLQKAIADAPASGSEQGIGVKV